ncbi:hypothetical protein H696_04431 [Fonticula alba]|uniref:GOLD domain-containing protein n=1 Tax=Fonticula alba TaxID=691883 RepID=A0A058Z4I1_FONAL|nr:hypothetical protein H696_04431 [Fonticula alba]KCV69011.1 hypothetical protein H696_04431 [Fonticula alba]|eukprot:XP_009496582.1 hypothetical protein H696_04431 [Fonticula alba]
MSRLLKSCSGLVLLALAVLGLLAAPRPTPALTVELEQHDTVCFYQDAVANDRLLFTFSVLSGGDMDIDYEIRDPVGGVLHSGKKESDGEALFIADDPGEYALCFSNEMSTFSHKVIKFDVRINGEEAMRPAPVIPKPRATPPSNPNASNQVVHNTLNTIDELFQEAYAAYDRIASNQGYYHTREKRNMFTVVQTERRVFWTTVIECLFIIGLALLQVYIVRSFFIMPKNQRRA